jgi:rRNA small subunit pseudouridine methyltransferase Nep1
MLRLVLAESALQRVPAEILSHPQIERYAARRDKTVSEILLDRSYHHAAMLKLARKRGGLHVERMGRPDIVHTTLLQVLETPLNWERQLETFVHTQEDYVISLNPKVRIPKNYTRFAGLMEQLFSEGQVPRTGDPLLKVRKMTLSQLVSQSKASDVFAFSILGKPMLMRDVADHASRSESPMVLVGGFPRGHFAEKTRRMATGVFRVDDRGLDAWVVAGRFVYDFEWSIGVAQRCLKRLET